MTEPDHLAIFCREVRNLLRSKPNCMIPFSKFVPAYHNHYGRQCCVYQFGYTKLIELLESIPHVVQIIGCDGPMKDDKRYIALTHREQIKRFASDLIKVVKSQPGKRLKLSQFAQAYEQALGRTFRVLDYGTNNINVLLAEIWEGTINIIPIKREHLGDEWRTNKKPLFVDVPLQSSNSSKPVNPVLERLVNSHELVNKPYITDQYPDCWFEIPKRERSEREIKRTKYFIWDVIELLSRMKPNYSVAFSKFIPAYHYYFNRQCKVSIFGFSKLIDLLESISPDVVEILDMGPGEEKVIQLAKPHWPSPNSPGPCSGPPAPKRAMLASSSCSSLSPQSAQGQHYNAHQHHYQQRRKFVSANALQVANSKGSSCSSALSSSCPAEPSSSLVSASSDSTSSAGSSASSSPSSSSSATSAHSSSSSSSSSSSCSVVAAAADQVIDHGPTEEEMLELEDELEAYEQLEAIRNKRSTRMAAILDIFKYSIY